MAFLQLKVPPINETHATKYDSKPSFDNLFENLAQKIQKDGNFSKASYAIEERARWQSLGYFQKKNFSLHKVYLQHRLQMLS